MSCIKLELGLGFDNISFKLNHNCWIVSMVFSQLSSYFRSQVWLGKGGDKKKIVEFSTMHLPPPLVEDKGSTGQEMSSV